MLIIANYYLGDGEVTFDGALLDLAIGVALHDIAFPLEEEVSLAVSRGWDAEATDVLLLVATTAFVGVPPLAAAAASFSSAFNFRNASLAALCSLSNSSNGFRRPRTARRSDNA